MFGFDHQIESKLTCKFSIFVEIETSSFTFFFTVSLSFYCSFGFFSGLVPKKKDTIMITNTIHLCPVDFESIQPIYIFNKNSILKFSIAPALQNLIEYSSKLKVKFKLFTNLPIKQSSESVQYDFVQSDKFYATESSDSKLPIKSLADFLSQNFYEIPNFLTSKILLKYGGHFSFYLVEILPDNLDLSKDKDSKFNNLHNFLENGWPKSNFSRILSGNFTVQNRNLYEIKMQTFVSKYLGEFETWEKRISFDKNLRDIFELEFKPSVTRPNPL